MPQSVFPSFAELERIADPDKPCWVYDIARARVPWANALGLSFWGAGSINDLAKREFSSDSSTVRERLTVLAKSIPEQGSLTDTWTLYPNDRPQHVLLSFQRVTLDEDDMSLLVCVLKTLPAPADDTFLRMAEATRATSSLITMMSLDGRVLMQNPKALKCYGPPLPATSVFSDLQMRLRTSHDIGRIEACISQNIPLRFETEVQTQEGPRVHSISVERGRDPVDGAPIILISEEDVAELSGLYREQEIQAAQLQTIVADHTDQLQKTKERIDRVLQVAAIWDWDIATDKLYFSSNFMHLLQYEPEEFMEKLRRERFAGIIHPEDYAAYMPMLEDFLANPDKPISHEMRFVSKSGELLWIQIEGKSFCDEQGKPIKTAGLLTNITQKKQIEAALMASQKMEAIGRLTGGIAHDFNNLLTVIQGNAQLLEEVGALDTEFTSEIISAAARGAELTRHMLAFARKQRLTPEPIDITELAMTMRKTVLRILSETITVDFEGQEGLWNVFADISQTEAAILNIALNARDAMPNGGHITIKAENVTIQPDAPRPPQNETSPSLGLEPGDYVKISISDSGTGMDPYTANKAFEPFFSTKDVGKGSGLGLSMVLGFSQQSGGNAAINSELGKGSTVSIYLPRSEQPTAVPEQDAETVLAVGQGEHVHILEDNQEVSSIVAKMVESLGYRITTSGTVAEALSMAEQHPDIAAFLVDVILPGGKTGVDFASEVLALRSDARLVLMSGYPEAQLMRDVTQTFDFAFLSKPFNRRQISTTLAETLQK